MTPAGKLSTEVDTGGGSMKKAKRWACGLEELARTMDGGDGEVLKPL